MIMKFVFNKAKAETLGYTVEACYEAVDKIFAKYDILPHLKVFMKSKTIKIRLMLLAQRNDCRIQIGF